MGFVEAMGRNYQEIREIIPEETFVRVFTFNSERKSMSTVIPTAKGYRVFTKGAAEIVVSKYDCSFTVHREWRYKIHF